MIPCPECGALLEPRFLSSGRWTLTCDDCRNRAIALRGLAQTGEPCPECGLPTLRRFVRRSSCLKCGYGEDLIGGTWEPRTPPSV